MPIALTRRQVLPALILLVALGAAGGIALYRNRSGASSVAAARIGVNGKITNQVDLPLEGTLSLLGQDGKTLFAQVGAGGLFQLPTFSKAGAYQASLKGDDGWNYVAGASLEAYSTQLTPQVFADLSGWIRTTQWKTAAERGDALPPAISGARSDRAKMTLTFTLKDAVSADPEVEVYYRRVGTTAWAIAPLTANSGTAYTVSFGGLPSTAAIQYFITAQDENGNRSWLPAGGSSSPTTF